MKTTIRLRRRDGVTQRYRVGRTRRSRIRRKEGVCSSCGREIVGGNACTKCHDEARANRLNDRYDELPVACQECAKRTPPAGMMAPCSDCGHLPERLKHFNTRRRESRKSVYDMSSKEKVAELGLDADEFSKDLFEMDDEITGNLLHKGYSSENIEKTVYPPLNKFKSKYKIDIPLGLFGVDVARLDNKLNSLVEEKRRKEETE